MKIQVHDIEEAEKHLVFDELTASLGGELKHGDVADFEFPEKTPVSVHFHRAGLDLFFSGHIASRPRGQCARCLEQYEFPLDTDFSVVLAPRNEAEREGVEDHDDVNLGFYEGEEVDLSPLVREQIILALPTRPLCRDDCRGLCSQCGANRNEVDCGCREDVGDPRLAVFRDLKVSR